MLSSSIPACTCITTDPDQSSPAADPGEDPAGHDRLAPPLLDTLPGGVVKHAAGPAPAGRLHPGHGPLGLAVGLPTLLAPDPGGLAGQEQRHDIGPTGLGKDN